MQCELERLRLAFSELRDEVDALKKEMEDDIPVLRRGVGIRILKDKIQRSTFLNDSDGRTFVLVSSKKVKLVH